MTKTMEDDDEALAKKQMLKAAMRRRGTVIRKTLPLALASGAIATACMLVRAGLTPIDPWWAPAIEHPLPIQTFGIMFAFLTTNRVKDAIERWMHGMSTVSLMLLKWHDSETFVLGYLKKDMKLLLQKQARTDLDESGRRKVETQIRQLSELREKLLHWFSLLNAIALSTLKHGEADCMNHVTCKNPKFDWLTDSSGRDVSYSKMETLRKALLEGQHPTDDSKGFQYLGEITLQEQKQLDMAGEKPALIQQWITEAMIFSDKEGLLSIPPPLAGRAHMRMADAMTGYNDAYRIAAVAYPAPVAQMTTFLMVCFVFFVPIVVEKFTKSLILTPIFSCIITISYWGLNQISKELENPFGDDVHDLPLMELCDAYIERIIESTQAGTSDLTDASNTVHTYSSLYIDEPCSPVADKAPAPLEPLASKGQKPEERQPSQKDPPSTLHASPAEAGGGPAPGRSVKESGVVPGVVAQPGREGPVEEKPVPKHPEKEKLSQVAPAYDASMSDVKRILQGKPSRSPQGVPQDSSRMPDEVGMHSEQYEMQGHQATFRRHSPSSSHQQAFMQPQDQWLPENGAFTQNTSHFEDLEAAADGRVQGDPQSRVAQNPHFPLDPSQAYWQFHSRGQADYADGLRRYYSMGRPLSAGQMPRHHWSRGNMVPNQAQHAVNAYATFPFAPVHAGNPMMPSNLNEELW